MQLKALNTLQLSKHNLFLNQNKASLKKSLRYTYKFASIISPGSLKDMTLVARAKTNSTTRNSLYVKQSYVLLT
jgi:hypothetical protein